MGNKLFNTNGGAMGMQLLDKSIADLLAEDKISIENALEFCVDKEGMNRSIESIKNRGLSSHRFKSLSSYQT
jgi:twitching motility protein PilT